MTNLYRPDWEAEDRTPMEQCYTVNMVDGAQLVWTGDFVALMSTHVSGSVAFLPCAGGTLINMAHIVTMTPVG